MKRLVLTSFIFIAFLLGIAVYFVTGALKQETDASIQVLKTSGNSVSSFAETARVTRYYHGTGDEGKIYTYTNKQIVDYFSDVVFSSELDGYVGKVCKWMSPVKYWIYGERNEEDLRLFDGLTEYLNGIEGFPGISEAENPDEANFEIYYTTEENMSNLFENYVPNSWGMASFWWREGTCEIVRARAAIVCDETDQYEKNTVVLEEITQAMGIGDDSYMYPESLYYQRWSQPQTMPYIDRCVLEILYNPMMEAGISEKEAIDIAYSILEKGYFDADEAD